jgi:hypothetical protein
MTRTLAPLMSAILNWDASTFQRLVTTRTNVPRTFAIQREDVYTLQRIVTMELLALLILVTRRLEFATTRRFTPNVLPPTNVLLESALKRDVFSTKMTNAREPKLTKNARNCANLQMHAKMLNVLLIRILNSLANVLKKFATRTNLALKELVMLRLELANTI